MKVAIIGSREYPNLQEVDDYLDSLKKLLPCLAIITGGANGVDKRAEKWALGWGVPCEIIEPIDAKDKFSYLLRNVEIITKADQIVAFWDGNSKGTQFVINYAKARGKFILIKSKEKVVGGINNENT